jgi:hypothetical protein
MLASLARLRRKLKVIFVHLTPGGARRLVVPGANFFDTFSVVIMPRCARMKKTGVI